MTSLLMARHRPLGAVEIEVVGEVVGDPIWTRQRPGEAARTTMHEPGIAG